MAQEKMHRIAALLTCHNRKNKTLNCLKSLHKAKNNSGRILDLDIYLTDDGSTDGTSEEVRALFPEVEILPGDGTLFWAEGMRHSWNRALSKGYDAYLLLNDDVDLYPNFLDQLFKCHEFCLTTFGSGGIYIGSTEDKFTSKLTYSGSLILNRFLYTHKRLPPNGSFQTCDLANANIMFVTAEVVGKIGILSEGYAHGMADYDYTLMARKKGIPVLVAPEYCGHCVNDHKDLYANFSTKTLKQRKAYLNKPTGLAFSSYKRFMRKFFPLRYPLVVFFGWFKLYFPTLYLKYFRNR